MRGLPFMAAVFVLLRRHDHLVDRPCRALFLLPLTTQGLVALAGLRTLGFEGGAPLGLLLFAVAGRK